MGRGHRIESLRLSARFRGVVAVVERLKVIDQYRGVVTAKPVSPFRLEILVPRRPGSADDRYGHEDDDQGNNGEEGSPQEVPTVASGLGGLDVARRSEGVLRWRGSRSAYDGRRRRPGQRGRRCRRRGVEFISSVCGLPV